MSKFEFRGFTPTPSEKHLGIAEVKIHGDTPIVLRFKIVSRKDGSGYFPNIASYKMPDRMPGEEYDECAMLDSRSDHDLCIKTVMHGVNQALQAKKPSVFSQQAQQQPPFIQRPEYQQSFSGMPDLPPVPEEHNLPF